MGNISGSDELVTKQELKAFYQAILPYLNNGSGGTTYTAGDGIDIINDIISTKQSVSGDMDEIIDSLPTGSIDTRAIVSGFTPLGTIISYYGETAPRFYLICDGSEYNKADYPELSAHLLSLTNHSQYEVDGDSTKFKVPDLRGEFLRGTGTNSHTNQGDGADVGEHQDGTLTPNTWCDYSNFGIGAGGTAGGSESRVQNADYKVLTSYSRFYAGSVWSNDAQNYGNLYTSRPTNTSVLYCISYKDIYISPMNNYSTDEKVIGTWVDGKPVYQKTFTFTTSNFDDDQSFLLSNYGINNVDTVCKVDCFVRQSIGAVPLTYAVSGNERVTIYFINNNNTLVIGHFGTWSRSLPGYITLQYTKTTD